MLCSDRLDYYIPVQNKNYAIQHSAEIDSVDVRVEKRMTQCFVDSSHWYIFSDVAY